MQGVLREEKGRVNGSGTMPTATERHQGVVTPTTLLEERTPGEHLLVLGVPRDERLSQTKSG